MKPVGPTYHERPAEANATDMKALVEVVRSALHFLEDLRVRLDEAIWDGALKNAVSPRVRTEWINTKDKRLTRRLFLLPLLSS